MYCDFPDCGNDCEHKKRGAERGAVESSRCPEVSKIAGMLTHCTVPQPLWPVDLALHGSALGHREVYVVLCVRCIVNSTGETMSSGIIKLKPLIDVREGRAKAVSPESQSGPTSCR
jgi:hypothetical protein